MDSAEQRAALEALVHEQGASLAALSEMLGRNPAYLQQYLQRGSPRLLAEQDRARLAAYLGVPEARLGGPGPALVSVPRLDIGASAGPGGLAGREARHRPGAFDPALLRHLGVRAEAASLVRVAGDSMEPVLADGDEILVDRDRRAPGSRRGLFVLRQADIVQVKWLRAAGSRIEVASENAAYPTVLAEARALQVIGRVVWLGRALV